MFFCVHNQSPLAQDPLRIKICQDPPLSYFFVGSFGKCISGSDTPAIWDRSQTSGLEFQGLRGI